MSKYRVVVQVRQEYTLVVEAPSSAAAYDIAEHVAIDRFGGRYAGASTFEAIDIFPAGADGGVL